jgi:hypothetical protein
MDTSVKHVSALAPVQAREGNSGHRMNSGAAVTIWDVSLSLAGRLFYDPTAQFP